MNRRETLKSPSPTLTFTETQGRANNPVVIGIACSGLSLAAFGGAYACFLWALRNVESLPARVTFILIVCSLCVFLGIALGYAAFRTLFKGFEIELDYDQKTYTRRRGYRWHDSTEGSFRDFKQLTLERRTGAAPADEYQTRQIPDFTVWSVNLVWKDAREKPFLVGLFRTADAARISLRVWSAKLSIEAVDTTREDLVAPGSGAEPGEPTRPPLPSRTRLRVVPPEEDELHVVLRLGFLHWIFWAFVGGFSAVLYALYVAVEFGAAPVLCPFVGLFIVGYHVLFPFWRRHVLVTDAYVEIFQKCLWIAWDRRRMGTPSVKQVYVTKSPPSNELVIQHGYKTTKIGGFCPPQDVEWLANAIKSHLRSRSRR